LQATGSLDCPELHSAVPLDALASCMTSIESTSGNKPADANGDFEGRWDAWRARGLAHDRLISHRLREWVPAVVVVAVIVYAFIVMW
jgi:hypothetical protein